MTQRRPSNCLPIAAALGKAFGAVARAAPSTIFMRMAACGHTREHCPHWMQVSASHWGTCTAMLRFSYWVVAVGQVPSAGIWETLMEAPFPSIIRAVTSLTKVGALSGTVGGIACPPAVFGTVTWRILFRAASTAA